ncbi:hypothetical protein FK220_010195 [Flavobacteriaceae bacterium TP-CH-4]|uniref:Uncharacterized protein n=1 Tax=Pelagihabitans pacificus TaxID=2696054 RepID=A0A967AVB2_9FLAO|nr:hypothetical protein [Pelagihabitans pacificus]NHF59713.1 hypothetical protein [Pelagihabitans pacificus]
MANTEIIGKEFYENLGKLFYAVAMADKSIHTKEIDKLRTFIRKYWLDVDEVEDEYGEDAAFQIEAVFDWLLEYEKNAYECFEEFQEFYKDHQRRFTPYIKVLILDTAHSIAASFSGKNKSELVLLGKLGLLLDQ